jgi:hypothetical protein
MANERTSAMIPSYLLSDTGCERDVCHATGCPQAVKERAETGRFYITMGHPGFNSPANNRDGYATKAKALAAIRRYSARYLVGGKRFCETLEEAKATAQEIFETTGAIVSIEERR